MKESSLELLETTKKELESSAIAKEKSCSELQQLSSRLKEQEEANAALTAKCIDLQEGWDVAQNELSEASINKVGVKQFVVGVASSECCHRQEELEKELAEQVNASIELTSKLLAFEESEKQQPKVVMTKVARQCYD